MGLFLGVGAKMFSLKINANTFSFCIIISFFFFKFLGLGFYILWPRSRLYLTVWQLSFLFYFEVEALEPIEGNHIRVTEYFTTEYFTDEYFTIRGDCELKPGDIFEVCELNEHGIEVTNDLLDDVVMIFQKDFDKIEVIEVAFFF